MQEKKASRTRFTCLRKSNRRESMIVEQWGKDALFNKRSCESWLSVQEKKKSKSHPNFSVDSKLYSRSNDSLDVKNQTKFKEKN